MILMICFTSFQKKMKNSSKFFCNKEYEYFPCHKGIADEEFNCLFCYCPLYKIDDCGGSHTFIGAKKIKDCLYCTLPHKPESYDYIIRNLQNA